MKSRLPVRAAILKRKTYEAPAEGRANKIRLDFNENTSGCGPAVLRALAKLTPQQSAMYPEYQKSTASIARHLGISSEELLLTNGGDDALRVFFRHVCRTAQPYPDLRTNISHVSLLGRNCRRPH